MHNNTKHNIGLILGIWVFLILMLVPYAIAELFHSVIWMIIAVLMMPVAFIACNFVYEVINDDE